MPAYQLDARSAALVVAALGLPVLGFATARAIDDYRLWLSLGAGGLPYNIYGYLINRFLVATLARDTRILRVYDEPGKWAKEWPSSTPSERNLVYQSFATTDLPVRAPPMAHAIYQAIPQREEPAGQFIDPDVEKACLPADAVVAD